MKAKCVIQNRWTRPCTSLHTYISTARYFHHLGCFFFNFLYHCVFFYVGELLNVTLRLVFTATGSTAQRLHESYF